MAGGIAHRAVELVIDQDHVDLRNRLTAGLIDYDAGDTGRLRGHSAPDRQK
jgi:hypothetical protein